MKVKIRVKMKLAILMDEQSVAGGSGTKQLISAYHQNC
jgi:hypothetical protein